jgi:hypothetical protein
MVQRDRMIQLKVNSSKVKINIMLNRAGLLLINIYINDVRCRILQQQHHFGEMIAYHASPARLVKTLTKDETDIGAMVSYIFTYRDSRTIRML